MTAISDPDEAAAIDTITDAQWHKSMARNLDTTLYVTRAAVPHLIAAGAGRIVNVTSVSGPVMAFADDVGYHAARPR